VFALHLSSIVFDGAAKFSSARELCQFLELYQMDEVRFLNNICERAVIVQNMCRLRVARVMF
jgi:hypothetical protein